MPSRRGKKLTSVEKPPTRGVRLSAELDAAIEEARAQIQRHAKIPVNASEAIRLLLVEALTARGIVVASTE